MTERPILFSAPMVRAILAAQKTQTRRAMKLNASAVACCCGGSAARWAAEGDRWHCGVCGGGARLTARDVEYVRCPYGQPGDRLWVRETFAEGIHQMADVNHWAYAADLFGDRQRLGDRWKPSIHMPRAASRITLEVTGVRVERLQAISDADVHAEGVAALPTETRQATPRCDYRALWESINGPESWATNPWVWVVEFKRVA